MIRAGTLEEINPTTGEWLFVDVGFSSRGKSCGILGSDNLATAVTFSDAAARIKGGRFYSRRAAELADRGAAEDPRHSGPYWFFFYSFDCNEPMDVHVRRDRQQVKFWLAPVALAWNHGFSSRELNDIRRLIVEHEQAIIGAWHEHCGQR